ncbi:MAG: PSD1 domain-containing protein [Planctomycetes bacterium]|nr:PSD1 domain-containing protein [Planctomycetota bacterium]
MAARVAVLASLVAFPAPGARAAADFRRDVRPILARRCHRCHGAAKRESGLRLDAAGAILHGGNRGPAVAPGKSSASLLIDAVLGRGEAPAMPPEGARLEREEVAVLERWIDEGAAAPPGDEAPPDDRARAGAAHWAFQPVRRTVPPAVRRTAWARGPIDAYVLARLEAEDIAPSPEAHRATLIRRLSLDLTGLPPSAEEVEELERDESPDALERAVDRLLASPHQGERWARHWLDQARYADSNGYTIDGSRSIWKYRDWVIRAISSDVPFDELVVEQIAGDMLPDATVDQRIATGFHRNTLRNEEGGTDQEQFRVEAVADRVSTTGSVFLGLTVGCARCHDHKYDPLSQREFYQLFAFFNGADEPALEVPTEQQARELPLLDTEIAAAEKLLAENELAVAKRQVEWEAKLRPLLASATPPRELLEVPENVRCALARAPGERAPEEVQLVADHYKSIDKDRIPLAQRVADLTKRKEQLKRSITTTLVLAERPEPRPTHIHIRGDFLRPGARVEPRTPAVLPPVEPRGPRADRLDLARWLVGPRNPLTPRVTANRVWQACFGKGLVETENDLGAQGSPPTHPELLDWLAAELSGGGWSLKRLLRAIATSAAYRQSSRARPDLLERDPRNLLLARQSRLRLEAEAIRDAALAASGLLSREIGGPGVYPPQPQGLFRFTQTAKYWKESQGADRYRRGMYTYFWRSSPYPLLATFDAPDATTACTRRARSNTPLQALTLANDPAFFEMAQALGARLLREAPGPDEARVPRAFRLCVARQPSERELARVLELVEAERAFPDSTPEGVWTAVARTMLNLDELITRE